MRDNSDQGFDRPFKMEPAPELSKLSEVPEWKKADFSVNWGHWEEDLAFRSSGFSTLHVDPEDWW